MKILFHSVSPWVGTGYGQQTATFCPRIAGLGHDLAISAYYGLQGAQLQWNGLKVYPAYAAGYGTDVIVTHALDHFGAEKGTTFREAAAGGLIITLTDVWTQNAPLLPDMAVAAWCPVDHVTLPGITRRWFETTGAVPVAMSRHGERQLRDGGLDPLYVPHGFDSSVFKPGDRAEARERTGLPDGAFIVAMVAANVGNDGSRKAFAEQITAFAELRSKHSDALLVLHTDLENRAGVNLNRMLEKLPEGSWIGTDQYAYRKGIPNTVVADIYRSADVFTNCSWGEGFGVPIVESQACGTPVVVTDATAMSELCGAGWAVGWEPLWHESQDAWASIPRIAEIAAAYVDAYDKAEGLRGQAADFAQIYDADFVTDTYWAPALAHLERGLEQRLADARSGRHAARSEPVGVRQGDGLLWVDRGEGTEDYLGWSTHEQELGPIIASLVDEDAVFVDIGAHVGHWSLRMAGRVHAVVAVEANPVAASGLRRNVAMNDIGNVTVLEGALWDEQTTLRLDDPAGGESGGSTRTVEIDREDAGGRVVEAFPFDRLRVGTLDLDRRYVVKLDVEGADLHVLRGMAGWLGRRRPVLLIECHDYAGYYTREELESCLYGLGYTWRTVLSYKSTWSPDGPLAEPVDADYLIATPVPVGVESFNRNVAHAAVVEFAASQHVDELAEAVQLVDDLHDVDGPTAPLVVEIGCDAGGTLWAWGEVAGPVYGITLADNSYPTGGTPEVVLDPHGATVITGDSHDRAVREDLADRLDGRPVDVLVLDGDHSVEGIWSDLADYGPLVRPGGVILLHDIAVTHDERARSSVVWPFLEDQADLLGVDETRRIVSPVHALGWGVLHVGPKGFAVPDDVAGRPVANSEPGRAS